MTATDHEQAIRRGRQRSPGSSVLTKSRYASNHDLTRTSRAVQTAVNSPEASRLSLKQQTQPRPAKASSTDGGLSDTSLRAEDCETPLDEKDVEEQATPRPEETFYPDGGLLAWSVVFVRRLSRVSRPVLRLTSAMSISSILRIGRLDSRRLLPWVSYIEARRMASHR